MRNVFGCHMFIVPARAAGRGGIPHLVAVISHKVSVRAAQVQ